jgi:hypothetical protein
VYQIGSSIPKSTTENLRDFLISAPIFGSVYRGGNVFELKSEYERTAQLTQSAVTPLVSKYQSDVAKYESNLKAYNDKMAEYNQNKTDIGYRELTSMQNSLQQQKSQLDIQKEQIDARISRATSAENRYNIAAGELTGNVNQKNLITYGAGSFIGDIGKGYSESVEKPVGSITKPLGSVGEFITGVFTTPSQIALIGQAGLIGGETIVRNIQEAPGIATAGLAMQAKGTYELSQTNPAGLLGTIAGIALVTGGVRAIGSKGVGMVRTSGMEYVPVESVGYDVNQGFAIGSPTESGLVRSFQQGTLSPLPQRMSIAAEVPYVPGVAGRPYARLPNAAPNDIILWTGHESNALTRGVNVGEAIHLTTPGTSEVSGIYGASALMSYFTKAGGQIPKVIGLDLPLKTPTVYSTVVSDIEAVPKGISRQAISGDYGPMNRYIQAEATARPGGQAFLPMAKAEYEAVIPTGSVIEITGRTYYTKLGGFGESHFLGTRVPIVEQAVIGFEPSEAAIPGVMQKGSGISYMEPKPIISLTNVYSGISANPAAAANIPSGYRFGESDKTPSITREAYRYAGSGVSERAASSRVYPTSPSYKTSGMLSPTEPSTSRITESLSYSETPVSTSRLLSSSYKTSAPEYPYEPGAYSYLGASSPLSIVTAPTSITAPPSEPSTGVPPPITPITPMPPLSGSFPFGSGSGGGGPRRRKRKVELFSFEMGEDTPVPTRYGLGGKTVFYIPGTRGIAADILPRGDIAPNRLFDIRGSQSGDHL